MMDTQTCDEMALGRIAAEKLVNARMNEEAAAQERVEAAQVALSEANAERATARTAARRELRKWQEPYGLPDLVWAEDRDGSDTDSAGTLTPPGDGERSHLESAGDE